MEINTKKTKVMRISKDVEPLKIVVNNRELKNVSQVRFLGSILNIDAHCTREIRKRIGMVKVVFNKNLRTEKLDLKLRKTLLKCYVTLHGSETWILRKM